MFGFAIMALTLLAGIGCTLLAELLLADIVADSFFRKMGDRIFVSFSSA